MQTFPMPSNPGRGGDNPNPKPPADPWGKLGVANPSKPKENDGDDDDKGSDTSSYAKGGKVPVKGEGARTAHYAAGGAVLGRTRSFMKEPDTFSAGMAVGDTAKAPAVKNTGSPQDYEGGKPKGKWKSDASVAKK